MYCKTQLKRNVLFALVGLVVAAALVTGLVLVIRIEPKLLDENALSGEPQTVAGLSGYVSYETPDVCRVKINCEPVLTDGCANIYLTSPAENDVLIRAELYSVKVVRNEETGEGTFLPDKLLGKTGFIRPGTFVERVKVKGIRPGENTKVMVKISTMYEDTGTSKGTFYIRTNVN